MRAPFGGLCLAIVGDRGSCGSFDMGRYEVLLMEVERTNGGLHGARKRNEVDSFPCQGSMPPQHLASRPNCLWPVVS
jgi:hypothetical protein